MAGAALHRQPALEHRLARVWSNIAFPAAFFMLAAAAAAPALAVS